MYEMVMLAKSLQYLGEFEEQKRKSEGNQIPCNIYVNMRYDAKNG